MTRSQDRDGSAWWESELLTIRDEQGAYLRRRLPALRDDHEDLVSDTMLSLTKQIRLHSAELPASWFQSTPPPNDAERSYLHKLAMVILKRRIADLFRKRATVSNIFAANEVRQSLTDSQASPPERRILIARMLEVTLSVLDEMQPEDRDLIALISEEAGFRKALNDRERKRLHRIRRRLKDQIARRLGAEVADLLRITL